MKKNYSPWLYQLRKDRANHNLHEDISADVAIIGAGIAGISTAFFTLKSSYRKKVVLLEKYKLAHGATGHNAGQVVSYFERGFASLVEEFGLKLATEGQKAIEDAWQLLDQMYTEAGLNIPFSRFLGHAGLASYELVMHHLKNNLLRKEAGLNTEQILISQSAPFLHTISSEYRSLYRTVPQEYIRELLETKTNDFVAVISYQKGCVNSALLCEEILLYLLKQYPDRFFLYEHTSIDKIILKKDNAFLDAGKHTIKANRVILCTNGFEGVTIINEGGLEVNTRFHHMVHGTIGYMSGYVEKMNKSPIAISYLTDPDPSTNDPYFYLTRRMYEYESDKDVNLISIGGPEIELEDKKEYSYQEEYPENMYEKIKDFVEHTYNTEPNKKIEYVFTWHGLMGYTQNGVRLIGPEPKNQVLLYNLGCNGVGILPSVYGGKRISDMLAGKRIEKSIFDVPGQYH